MVPFEEDARLPMFTGLMKLPFASLSCAVKTFPGLKDPIALKFKLKDCEEHKGSNACVQVVNWLTTPMAIPVDKLVWVVEASAYRGPAPALARASVVQLSFELSYLAILQLFLLKLALWAPASHFGVTFVLTVPPLGFQTNQVRFTIASITCGPFALPLFAE